MIFKRTIRCCLFEIILLNLYSFAYFNYLKICTQFVIKTLSKISVVIVSSAIDFKINIWVLEYYANYVSTYLY